MARQQQRQQLGKRQSRRRHFRMHWTVISIVLIAISVFAVAAILILMNEGISQGAITLTILSIIVGVVVGLLSLMFNFFQWSYSKPSDEPNPLTASHSSSQPIDITTSTFSSAPLSQQSLSPTITTPSGLRVISPNEDWGEAPHIENFYGRENELAELEQWIVNDHCRLVALLGIGGIGKTAVAAKLLEQIKDEFEYIFWRSLQNAPPLESILKNCIQFLSNQQRVNLPDDIESQISLLFQYLRDHRCLLILDNLETILQAGIHAGQHREGYEAYGRLIQRVGEVKHQSCLLLTSREKPKEVAQLEGTISPVRFLQLPGLGQLEGQGILKDKGLFGSDETWAALIRLYSGNPLALKLASEPIRELFGGDVDSFLKKGKAVFGDIRDPLDLQFTRLSELEREIMYWLAIEREAISLDELREDIAHSVLEEDLLEAMGSLRRRLMIEINGIARFNLQPVIREYVTDRFVEQVYKEIEKEAVGVFGSHTLIKANAKDFIRESQIRLILTPIAEHLNSTFGKEGIEKKLKSMLSTLRETHPQKPGYAAGNVLNLLIHFQSNLRGYDFSHLTVWQAYLQNANLSDVNFAHADLAKSVFTETFGSIVSVAFSPNGNLLAVGTAPGEIRLWQVSTSTPLLTCRGHTDWIRSVSFSPDGNMLASGSEDQTIRLWEVSTGDCLKILQGHINRVRSIAFSPDNQILASGSDDGRIRIWEVSTGDSLKVLHGHTNQIWSVAFSHDGATIASGSEDQTIRLWEVSTGQCLKILRGHSAWIWSVAFSHDGATIASGSGDQTVRLWEASTGQCLKTLRGHTSWVHSIAFSPDNQILASGSEERTVRLWEINTGQCLKTLQGHLNQIWSVSFSPDGNMLASGSEDQTIRLWEVSTGQCLKILQGHTHRIYSVAFQPNGGTLVSSSHDRTIRLWEISTGQCLKILQGHSGVIHSVAFSPDGQVIASSSSDQTIRLWEASTGHCLKTLQGHTVQISSVAFSPDGSMLASSSQDGTIKLWIVQTGVCLKTLRSDGPYERMDITDVRGLTVAQKAMLRALGAIEK